MTKVGLSQQPTGNSSGSGPASAGTSASSAAASSAASSPASSATSISSSGAAPTKVNGICQIDGKNASAEIEKGGSVTWSFLKMGTATTIESYEWTFDTGSDPTSSKDASTSVTYAKPSANGYGATVVLNKGMESENTIPCSQKVVVTGTKVSGCKCTTTMDPADGDVLTKSPVEITWKVNGCTGGEKLSYKWSGDAEGTGTTATKSADTKGTYKASITVTNEDGNSQDVSCDAATVIDKRQPDNFSCSVSPEAINLGESFVFTISGYSGTIYGASLTGTDGYSIGYTTSTLFTITPTQAGVIEYDYSITNGSDSTGTCAQYVTVTDNSSSWKDTTVSIAWEGTAVKFVTERIYSITYSTQQGSLYCDANGPTFICNDKTYPTNPYSHTQIQPANCVTLKVLGSGTLSCSHHN